jgi:20S proteasome subunit alpha 2
VSSLHIVDDGRDIILNLRSAVNYPLCHTDPPATNGIVIATEKKSASLLLDTSVIEKVAPICPNIGFVYSGMGPDFRVLVAKARKIAQAYWKVYGEYPPTKVLVQEVAGVMQKATQSG